MPWPDGPIMHAAVRLGDARVLRGALLGETRALLGSLSLYVHAVDTVDTRALLRRGRPRPSPMGLAALASRPPSVTSGGNRFCPSVCLTDRAARHQVGAAAGVSVAWMTGMLLSSPS